MPVCTQALQNGSEQMQNHIIKSVWWVASTESGIKSKLALRTSHKPHVQIPFNFFRIIFPGSLHFLVFQPHWPLFHCSNVLNPCLSLGCLCPEGSSPSISQGWLPSSFGAQLRSGDVIPHNPNTHPPCTSLTYFLLSIHHKLFLFVFLHLVW